MTQTRRYTRMKNAMTGKRWIVDNLGYRLNVYHPRATIQLGVGNPDADVVVVQPHTKMPERDAITGALKKFGMLGNAYRATSTMVDYGQPDRIEYPDLLAQNMRGQDPMTQVEVNRYYVKELIEIIRPLMVIACGPEVRAMFKQHTPRSFTAHSGKTFRVDDMPGFTFFATLNPQDYGFARASQDLKDQGHAEWTKLSTLYRKLEEKRDKARYEA